MKNLIAGIFFLFNMGLLHAQSSSKKAAVFTADSITSGNTKDIITNFFQFALNNLTSANRELNISASPYGIMLKKNPKLNLDSSYKKYKSLRRLNVRLGMRLDSSFRFNGFTSGLKFSIIDKRDFTTSGLIAQKLQNDSLNKERFQLQLALTRYARINFPNALDTNSADYKNLEIFNDNKNKLLQDVPYSRLDPAFQRIVAEVVAERNLLLVNNILKTNPNSSFAQIDAIKFDSLKNTIKNALLWTIGVTDTTYTDKFQFAAVEIVSELSKGIAKSVPGANNVELNIRAAYNFVNDTLVKGRNLKRQIFSIEPGVNWVIRDKENQSFFELKLSGSYYYTASQLHTSEIKNRLSLNGTARIRIYQDIWIPIEIRYDPKNGNILGLLNVRANFAGIGRMMK